MKSFLAFVLILLCAPLSHAVSSTHCPKGCPTGTPWSNYHVWRAPYTLSNNATTKFADWVAYTVSPSTIGGGKTRSWRADPNIWSSRTLEPADYTGANAALATDRGHQAPLASLSAYSDWKALNYLSNITPQKSNLNQGPWRILEERVRTLAQRSDINAVYVATGPLYEYNVGSLPGADESHTIPSAYWKVIYVDNGSVQTAAFIMDQSTPRSANFCYSITSIDQVESRSGLNLLPSLSNASSIEPYIGKLKNDLGC